MYDRLAEQGSRDVRAAMGGFVLPSDLTSCTLLEQARGRDGAAWQRLVVLYTPLVRDWCRRLGVPPGEADDVVQESFLAVSVGLADFEPQRVGSFRKWVRGIVRHR